MHEMSIATELIDQILAAAASHGLQKVEEVVVETGALRQIVPDVMQAAFEAVSKGTIAEGAELTIVEVPARARCRKCGQEFEPQPDNFLCPLCLVADMQVVQGEDIILKSVSGPDNKGE